MSASIIAGVLCQVNSGARDILQRIGPPDVRGDSQTKNLRRGGGNNVVARPCRGARRDGTSGLVATNTPGPARTLHLKVRGIGGGTASAGEVPCDALSPTVRAHAVRSVTAASAPITGTAAIGRPGPRNAEVPMTVARPAATCSTEVGERTMTASSPPTAARWRNIVCKARLASNPLPLGRTRAT